MSCTVSPMARLCSPMAHSVISLQFGGLYGRLPPVLCRHLFTRQTYKISSYFLIICQASLPFPFDCFHISSVVRTGWTYLVEFINSTVSDWFACVIKHVNIPFYYKQIIYLDLNLYSLWLCLVLLSLTQSTSCHK